MTHRNDGHSGPEQQPDEDVAPVVLVVRHPRHGGEDRRKNGQELQGVLQQLGSVPGHPLLQVDLKQKRNSILIQNINIADDDKYDETRYSDF